MPRFWYSTADTPDQRRYLEAPALPEALLSLRAQGVTLAAAGEAAPSTPRLPRVSESLLTSLYEQLAALLEQGVELSVALRRLAREAASGRLARCLRFLADRVEQGVTLSEAMEEQPTIFAEVAVAAAAAGEASGNLAGALRSLAVHQRDLQRLGADLSLPLLYPLFLLAIMTAALLLVPTFLIDKFVALYKELGMKEDELPILTRLMMDVVPVIRFVGIPVLIGLAGFTGYYQVRMKVRAGRLEVRPLGLPIPLFGRLARSGALARAAATLRLLLGADVPVGRALRLAGEASGSRHVSLALRRAEDALSQGGRLSDSLQETGLLPEAFVFALSAAEGGGTLLDTLGELEEEYRRDVGLLARQWVVMMGPVVVIVVGAIIGTTGISLWMPLMSVISKLSS
jgi:type II secretory pathway component PulF